jgi:hypothetical protein
VGAVGYSPLSIRLISTPAPTTTAVVAMTITPAAFRTDGGSRKKRATRRSMRFRRPYLENVGVGV